MNETDNYRMNLMSPLKKGNRTAKHAKFAKKKKIHGFILNEIRVKDQGYLIVFEFSSRS